MLLGGSAEAIRFRAGLRNLSAVDDASRSALQKARVADDLRHSENGGFGASTTAALSSEVEAVTNAKREKAAT
jgi:hypothetical protein